MERFDLSSARIEWDESDPEGFRSGRMKTAPAGAEGSGASLFELPPGQAICPYHYELAEEEWLLVISGEPTLRTPEGSHRVGPNELFFFPKGADGAHEVRNETDQTVRVLMWSTVVYPAATVYPDSDKLGVFTEDGADDLMVRRSSGVEYFDGEV